MANQSPYLKDRLGFDPDDFVSEVDELFRHELSKDEVCTTPTNKIFKSSYQSSPSSSTSSVKDSYLLKLENVKGML